MLTEMEQALARLRASGQYSSRAAGDLRQLHDRYSGRLAQIQSCGVHPHVMRILAEELVEELSWRLKYLGLPIEGADARTAPPYWLSYIRAVRSGELLDTEYVRFQAARELTAPFLQDSYVDEDELEGDYKTMRYAYALSSLPMPEWFSPKGVMERLVEIVTAYGFLWYSVVDYAEEQYYAKGA